MPKRAIGTPEVSEVAHWHSTHSVGYWSLPPISPTFLQDRVNVQRIAWVWVDVWGFRLLGTGLNVWRFGVRV